MYRYGGVSQAKIGKALGLDYSAVSRERKRIREKAQNEKALKAALRELESLLMS